MLFGIGTQAIKRLAINAIATVKSSTDGDANFADAGNVRGSQHRNGAYCS